MWVLVVIAVFSSGSLKGPVPNMTPHKEYYARVTCESDATAFNSIDFDNGADGVRLRAFCIPQ